MDGCPPFCTIPYKHQHHPPLSGPSRQPRNGRHHTVAPYPLNQYIRGSLGMIPGNPPAGTHSQMSANNNASGEVWTAPLGFVPTLPKIEQPTPIKAFVPDWRESRPRPPPRGNPRVYEVPLVPSPPPPIIPPPVPPTSVPSVPPLSTTEVTAPQSESIIPLPAPPTVPPPILPAVVTSTMVTTPSQPPVTPETASGSTVSIPKKGLNYWDDELDWGDD